MILEALQCMQTWFAVQRTQRCGVDEVDATTHSSQDCVHPLLLGDAAVEVAHLGATDADTPKCRKRHLQPRPSQHAPREHWRGGSKATAAQALRVGSCSRSAPQQCSCAEVHSSAEEARGRPEGRGGGGRRRRMRAPARDEHEWGSRSSLSRPGSRAFFFFRSVSWIPTRTGFPLVYYSVL
jgi:hypothetical protein